jgi:hypothetical protein
MNRFLAGKRFAQSARMSTLVVALTVFGTGTAQAGFIQFTNEASWDAAVTALGLGISVEDFADATLEAGLTTTNGSVSGGAFVAHASTQFNNIGNPRLNFSPGTAAFGGYWDLSSGGAGDGLVFVINGTNVSPFTPPGTQVGVVSGTFSGFLGWVSDDATTITNLRIDSPGTGDESFTLDNVRFAAGSAGPGEEPPGGSTSVPEPASVVLLGGGLLGLVVGRKRFV